MVSSWAEQLLSQLLIEQFDTWPIKMHRWCLHGPINSYHTFWWSNLILCLYNIDTLIICIKAFGSENKFLTKWQLWELSPNFPLIRLLYVHRWCLHGPINFYYSFWWNNLILCLYNVDTLNICMKEFGSEKIIFDKMTAVFSLIRLLYVHRWCLHGPINFYYSFWWNNLILCLYNVDTLNICMKEFGSEKIIFDKMTAVFSLIRLLYVHRWCLHGPINFYYSFWWNNLILCLYNVDTLNICMKEFGSEKIIFDKMTAVRT